MLNRTLILIASLGLCISNAYAEPHTESKNILVYSVSSASSDEELTPVEVNFIQDAKSELRSRYKWEVLNPSGEESRSNDYRYNFEEIQEAITSSGPLYRVQKKLDESALRHALLVGCQKQSKQEVEGFENCSVFLYDSEKAKIVAEAKRDFDVAIANPLKWSRYIIAQLWGGFKMREQQELQSLVSNMNHQGQASGSEQKQDTKYLKKAKWLDVGLGVDLINHKEELPKQQNYTLSLFSRSLGSAGAMLEYSPQKSGQYWGAHLGWKGTLLEKTKTRVAVFTTIGLRQEEVEIEQGLMVELMQNRYAILSLNPELSYKITDNVSISLLIKTHYLLNKHLSFGKSFEAEDFYGQNIWMTGGLGFSFSI